MTRAINTPELHHSCPASLAQMVRSRQVNLQKCVLCFLPLVSKALIPLMPTTAFSAIGNDAGAVWLIEKQWAGLIIAAVDERLQTRAYQSAIFRQGRQAGRQDGGLTRPRPLAATGRKRDRGARRTGRRQTVGRWSGWQAAWAGRPAGFGDDPPHDSQTHHAL